MPEGNNNNNDITSMALKSSEARAQKRNKTKSEIIFKSRGHTGIIISFKGPVLLPCGPTTDFSLI